MPDSQSERRKARVRIEQQQHMEREERRMMQAAKNDPYLSEHGYNSTLRDWLTRVEGRFMGVPVDIHPHDAIIQALHITWGEVEYCTEQIRRLSEDELFERPNEEVYAAGELIQVKRDAEVVSRWVQLRDSAMDRAARYSKMALDVGIEERQIELAENQAKQLVSVISAVLTDLGHNPQDLATRQIVRQRLLESAVESTAEPVSNESAA